MADKEKTRLEKGWAEIRPHAIWEVIRTLSIEIGRTASGGGVTAALYAMYRFLTNEPVSWLGLVLVFVVSSGGYFGISLYLRNKRAKARGEPGSYKSEMSAGMIIYVPIILGLVFCVWAYFVGSTLYRLSHEAETLRSNLDLYVKPRTLTEQRISSMADYLSQNPPQGVKIVVVANDPEAANYMGQIVSGLTRGGWTILGIAYDEKQTNEGISIHVELVGQPKNPDPKHPTPDFILTEALRKANIPIGGSSSSADTGAYTITIKIGRRPLVVDPEPRVRPKMPPPRTWK